MTSVADAVRAQKELIDAADDAMLRQMAKDWLGVEKALADKVTLLADEIASLSQAGKVISQGKLYQLGRFQNLLVQAQGEVAKYSGRAAEYIAGKQAESVALGVRHATDVLTGAVGGQFDKLSSLAVDAMIANTAGISGEGAPLRQLLFERMVRSPDGTLLPGVQERMIGTLRNALSQGWNPKKTAKLLRGDLAQGLDKALIIARTETMRAYRTANSEAYKESGVVEVQVRMAAHTTKTCLACLADEGKEYPIDEPIPDHPRGRCVGVPRVQGMPSPKFQTGEAWMKQQPESVQRSMMGDARYDLWKGGAKFGDFAKQTDSVTWGGGLGVTPLKDIKGIKGTAPKAIPTPRAAPTGGTVKAAGATREFTQAGDATRWGNKHYGDWRQNLSADERRGLLEYKGLNYKALNGDLRSGKRLTGGALDARNRVDAALTKAVVPERVVVYRGMNAKHLGDLTIGKTITDRAYVSTTLNRGIADKFVQYSRSYGNKAALVRITVPAGARGAYIDGLAQGGGLMAKIKEQELLLGRGAKFIVTGISGSGKSALVDLEMLL